MRCGRGMDRARRGRAISWEVSELCFYVIVSKRMQYLSWQRVVTNGEVFC